MAAVELPDLSSPSGLQEFNEYLSGRTYVSGDQPSKDDVVVLCALPQAIGSDLANVSRWHKHISALLQKHFPGAPVGVKLAGSPSVQTREVAEEAPAAPATPPAAEAEDDDDDLDLFGEETEEEKKASAERDAQKAASAKKKAVGKSSVLLDVKPWDDETDMVKLEEAVRSVSMPGLFWGASKLMPVGYAVILLPSIKSKL
ncbi:hypothetical protein L7F22_002072 [Adiantum nelumboides]|nr:hypothetical protein [Adiantum nelumboides]